MHDLWKPATEQWLGVGLLAVGVTLNMWVVGYSLRTLLVSSIEQVNRRLDRLEQMLEQTTLSMSPRFHNYGDEI